MQWGNCLDKNGVATLACIPVVLNNIINAALVFSGIVALILIIFSGIKFISSKGDQNEIDSAKKTLTYAIIGLIVIFLSFFVVRVIGQITGVEQISNPSL